MKRCTAILTSLLMSALGMAILRIGPATATPNQPAGTTVSATPTHTTGTTVQDRADKKKKRKKKAKKNKKAHKYGDRPLGKPQ